MRTRQLTSFGISMACMLISGAGDAFGQACTNKPFSVVCNPNLRHGNGGRAEVSDVCVGEQIPASGEIFFGDANADAWRVTSGTLRINNVVQDGGANQQIIGLFGNATCTNSGGICDPNTGSHCVFPCLIGPSALACGDGGLTLPGAPQSGSVVVGASYVIQPADAGTIVEVRFDFSNVDLGTADCTNTPLSAQPVVAFAQIFVPDCNDGNECTTDCCDTGVCSNITVCTDDSCAAGDTPKNCDDGLNCTIDSCDDQVATCCAHNPLCPGGVCCADGASCSDGLGCTDDSCVDGCCGHADHCPVDVTCCADGATCDDGLGCTDDACVDGCCGHTSHCPVGVTCCADGASCDDGDACTGDACQNGCCVHTPLCINHCGNGILDPGEECDGAANAACAGGFCQPDCTCGSEIPTVSTWGLTILVMLLLIGAKLRFTLRRTA